MRDRDNDTKEISNLELPAVLDISSAQILKEALGDAIVSGSDIVLSGHKVERVGTPAVQVLLAAAKFSEGERRRFALRSPSEALTSAFRELGLLEMLEQWSRN